MTRDMELIRRIIIAIQARKDAKMQGLEVPDSDPAVVSRHLELMEQAGLIEAIIGPRSDDDPFHSYPFVMVRDLTWAGHDLANVLANDNVWGQMKKKLSPAELATIPLSVIKDVGVALIGQLVKGQFGLP